MIGVSLATKGMITRTRIVTRPGGGGGGGKPCTEGLSKPKIIVNKMKMTEEASINETLQNINIKLIMD